MSVDPSTDAGAGDVTPGSDHADPAATARRREVVVAGHRGDTDLARASLADPSPAVRSAALGALARSDALTTADVVAALVDPDPRVRRRGAAAAVGVGGPGSRSVVPAAVRTALGDPDPLVVEGACWAAGERGDRLAVAALGEVAGGHADPRCREAAVAALGAVGDPAGLPSVLGSLVDRPTVRRRAVVALAAFDGPEVDAALERCRRDRDWQVRQAAEALLEP